MANNLSNVREFVIDSLKKYHQMLTAAEESALTTTLSDFVSKEYASSTYLTKQDAALTYITYEYAGNTYVAKENGKGLSEANFTSAEKTKLAGIAEGAQVNVQSDWNAASGDAQILNKPDLSVYPTSAEWDSTNHKIIFKNGNTVLPSLEISGADFVKDGMVTNVTISTPSTGTNAGKRCLIITFNSDADIDPIEVPIGDVFTPDNYYDKTAVDGLLDTKVDKVNGKQLSTEDYTTAEKTKLSGIAEGAQVNVIESVSVDGTALTVTAKGVNIDLSGKVDKVAGKGLSEADFTSTEKTKLAGIAEGAQVNVIESVKVNNTALTPDANKAVNITVPTKTSDLTNDSNFAVDTNYVHTDNNYTTDEKTKLNGIQAGAQVNIIESVKFNGTALTPDANKAVNIEVPNIPNISFSGSKSPDTGDYTYVANGFSASNHQITVSYTGVLTSHQDISGKEDTSNKKTSLSVAANISDTYYPTTSAVTTYIGSIAELSTSELNSIFAE